MNILHLTDLHLSATQRGEHDAPQRRTLLRIWQHAKRELPPAGSKFDFVVISGDLTQAAQKDEYDSLHEFLTVLLSEHVLDADPRRVVIVPGNHDVDWGAPYKETVPHLEIERDESLKEAFV